MKKYLLTIITVLMTVMPLTALAQTSSLWKVFNGILQPVVGTWYMELPSLINVPCLGTNGSGLIGLGTCSGGSGSGSGTFSTTSISTNNLLQYPYTTLTTSLDSSNSTSTSNFWYSPLTATLHTNTITASYFTATSTSATSTFNGGIAYPFATSSKSYVNSWATPPYQGARNDYGGSVGYEFKVNQPITVYKFGRLFTATSTQNHSVLLWDYQNIYVPLGSTTISASSPSDSNGFKYGNLVNPITLIPGRTYRIAIDEYSGGDIWTSNYSAQPYANNDIAITQGVAGNLSSFPGNTAGVEFDTANMLYQYPNPDITNNCDTLTTDINGNIGCTDSMKNYLANATGGFSSSTVNLIDDNDIGTDFDDAGSVGMLNILQDRGFVNVLAYMYAQPNWFGAADISAINTSYGHSNIPIGTSYDYQNGQPETDIYGSSLAMQYPNKYMNMATATDAVVLYRKILASMTNNSVTIVAEAPLRNIYNLFKSPGDSISPLTGAQLIQTKIKQLVIVAGRYPASIYGAPEFDFNEDYAAALIVNDLSTSTQVVYSGIELGTGVMSGAYIDSSLPVGNALRGANDLYYAYEYGHGNGPGVVGPPHSSWGEVGNLYAVFGLNYNSNPFFSYSSQGTNYIYATTSYNEGANVFSTAQPSKNQYYLIAATSSSVIGAAIDSIFDSLPMQQGGYFQMATSSITTPLAINDTSASTSSFTNLKLSSLTATGVITTNGNFTASNIKATSQYTCPNGSIWMDSSSQLYDCSGDLIIDNSGNLHVPYIFYDSLASAGTNGQTLSSTASGVKWVTQWNNITGGLEYGNGLDVRVGTTSLDNTFIGYQSGMNNTTGYNNVAQGYQALGDNTTGYSNLAEGTFAMNNNTTGTQNTAVGFDSLNNNTGGNSNTALGFQSLYSNTTGTGNVGNGMFTLWANTSGSDNDATGYYTLSHNTTGTANTANGFESLDFDTTGSYNTATGYYSLLDNVGGSNNTANGYNALENDISGVSNTADGMYSLEVDTASNNTANGYATLYVNTTGTDNLAEGEEALFTNITGSYNTSLGMSSLFYNDSATDTTAVGYGAGHGVNTLTNSQYNTFLGYESGYGNTTGNSNTVLGYQAGWDLSSGSNNIVIGQDVDLPSNTSSQQLNIGNLIYGTGVYNGGSPSATPVSGSVGIATSSPAVTLDNYGYGRNVQNGTTTACSGVIEGAMFFNTANMHEWGCNGTSWVYVF